MIDVANDRREAALFNSSEGAQTIAIGSTAAVGSTGEFARIVGDTFVQGGGENDVLRVLDEALYGNGVDGVELVSIDNDTAALGLYNAGGVRDIAVVDEIGAVIEDLSLGFVDAGNGRREFAFFDAAAGDTALILNTGSVGSTGEFARIVGDDFRLGGGENDLLRVLDEVLYGNGVDGVALNTVDDDSVSLELRGSGGAVDTVAFDNVGPVVGALSLGFVDAGNGRREFGYLDAGGDGGFVFANTAAVGTTGEFARIVGGGLERGDLVALLGEVLEGDGVEGATLNTLDDDSVALELATAGGGVDVLLIDNAGSILAGIYH